MPPFGISLSLSLSIHTLGYNLVTRQYLPIPCPRATDLVAGWLALWGLAILISLSVPFSLSAHLVPLTNQKMPRSSTKCPKNPGSRGEESLLTLNPKSPTPLLARPSPRDSFLELVFLRVFCPESSVSWDASDLLRTCPCGILLLLVDLCCQPAESHPLSASKDKSLLKFSEWLPFEVLEIASFLLMVVVVVVVFFFFFFLVFL